MDFVNGYVLLIVGVSVGVTLWRSIFIFPALYNRLWIAVSFLLLSIIGLSLVLAPDKAGAITGIIWLWLIPIPVLGYRILQRLIYQQRYSTARRFAQVLRWLHPGDGWFELPAIIYGFELEQRGSFTEAAQIFEEYMASTSLLSRAATIRLYQVEGRWQDLRTWLEQNLERKDFQQDINVISAYLRALGEIGELNLMLIAYNRFFKTIEKEIRSLYLDLLTVFAFCGERNDVKKLLEGPLKLLPLPSKELWLATADQANGDMLEGNQRLNYVIAAGDALLQRTAQRRLSQPLVIASDVLTPESREILEQAKGRLEQERRYSRRADFRRSFAPITLSLIALNLAVFVLEQAQGGSTNFATLGRLGGLIPTSVVYLNEWWRVLTALFLHYGPLHLVLNLLALYVLGPFAEFTFGSRKYLALYFVTGIGSMLTIIALTQIGQNQQGLLMVVGASGAIMGIIGANLAVLLRGWRTEKAATAKRYFLATALIVIFQVIVDLLMPQSSLPGHLSGAVLGFVLGSILNSTSNQASST